MHKYRGHAYIVDNDGVTILQDLGDYNIVIMEYGGTTANIRDRDTYIAYISNNLEDFSKFGGDIIVADGFSGVVDSYYGVFPAIHPLYNTVANSSAKIKIIFDDGYYLLGMQTISTNYAGTLFYAYDSNDNVLYSNVDIPGAVNGINNPSYTGNSPHFRAAPASLFTATGFDTSSSYIDYYFTYDSYWGGDIYSTNNNNLYKFLNLLAPAIDGYNITYDLDGCAGASSNPLVIPPNATITNFDFTPDTDYSFVFNSVYIDGDGLPSGTPIIYDWDPDTGHLKIGPITSNITVHVHAYIDPYADLPVDGEMDIPGGDVIPIPSLPGLGAVSAGVIGLFAPSPSQMQALANYMWTDFGGTGTTVEDILSEIVEAIKRVIANPLDYVVGLNIIPSQGLSIGSDRTIRFGFTNSGVSMPQLTSQYFVVDCGTLRFDTLCGDTFLDYAPYSKFSIYLPYVGIKEVDANDFVGHTIGVVYHGDVVTGGVTAYVTKDGSVMYQYSGCCALNVPLSADGWGSTIAGAVQIATSLVAGGFAGGAAGVAESAVKGAAAAAANPSLLSPKVQHSGAVSGGAGCMGVQTPFVIREAVRFHTTAGMNSVSGYPSFYYKSLGSVSGYTVVLDVHLKGIPATSEEIAEIESLLKSGVVL